MFDNKRVLLDDGIHTLAYGDKDIRTKLESICESRELFLMSYDEAKSTGLHSPHPIDPNMIQPRAPKMSYWKARSKTTLDKPKKRNLEVMTGDKPPSINDESVESSDEEARSKHKTPLISHSTTSPSLDLKPIWPPTIASPTIMNHQSPPSSPTLTDFKPAQSNDPLPSPPMSPTCDSDPFAPDDDSLSSYDSIF